MLHWSLPPASLYNGKMLDRRVSLWAGLSTRISILILLCTFAVITAFPLNSRLEVARPADSQEYILSPYFDIKSEPTIRKYSLTVTETTGLLDGFLRPVLAINGQIPGPLIEANEGDQLEITVINQMSMELTIHWHGLYQNGSNWEDGVTGVTQCPIPSHGGNYTYKFNLNGQFGTFWYHSHHQNLMADGINGPLIVHSRRDPLKRSIDFDQEVVLMLSDWYHNASGEIVSHMLTQSGYFGTPAAPGPNSALINGVGEWNCSQATESQQCRQTPSPPQFNFKAGERIRFRLVNAGVHAMFFYSIDNHKLNVTEADGTAIYGPSNLNRIWLHNGQRYSVIIKTNPEDAGKSFYMRATMDSDCWAWVPKDIQLTALGILRLVDGEETIENSSKSRPKTLDWPDKTNLEDCLDLDSNTMVPILKKSVPSVVVGSGTFESAFGFQDIENGQYITRAQATAISQKLNTSNSNSLNRRDNKISQESLRFGNKLNPLGITRQGGPPPTPERTIGKFFVNNLTWLTYPYQPVLHDLIPGGPGVINGSRVANVIFPTDDWYDLYIVNSDPATSHPYHLHAMDMHVVAMGKGFPTPKNLATLEYNTDNPLRRDTVVIPAASFLVARLKTDIPGAWIMHCHIGWHIAGGFAGVVVVQPEATKLFKIPKENLDLCKARDVPLDTIEPGV